MSIISVNKTAATDTLLPPHSLAHFNFHSGIHWLSQEIRSAMTFAHLTPSVSTLRQHSRTVNLKYPTTIRHSGHNSKELAEKSLDFNQIQHLCCICREVGWHANTVYCRRLTVFMIAALSRHRCVLKLPELRVTFIRQLTLQCGIIICSTQSTALVAAIFVFWLLVMCVNSITAQHLCIEICTCSQ